jgi:tetratricopeptide (TPR) repeat protein
MERKSYDVAITQCKNAVALDPSNFWYHNLLRSAYQAKGDLKNAIKVQEGVLARFGSTAAGLVQMAELQLTAGDAEKARFSLQASEQYRWEETEDLIRRKIALNQQLKAWDKVLQLTMRLIECDPENTEPYRIQYDTYLTMGLPDSAVGVLNTLLSSNRNHPFALLAQVKRLRAAGDNAQADSYMDRFATAYPEAPEAIVWKAQALKQQPASATSVAQARTLLAQNGRSLELWQLVFADDEARTDFAQLRSDAETGLEYFPNEMPVLLAFGIGSARTSKADDATFALEKVLKKADTPISLQARAAAELAVVYQQAGKTAEAKQTALRAQTLLGKLPAGDPVLPVCKQLLETFSGGN